MFIFEEKEMIEKALVNLIAIENYMGNESLAEIDDDTGFNWYSKQMTQRAKEIMKKIEDA